MGGGRALSVRRGRGLAALCAALAGVALAPGTAVAETASAPPSSAPPAAPTSTPVAGRLSLALEKVGGSPPFALVGRRLQARGSVTPYVAGQTVTVSFYLDGVRVARDVVGVLPATGGAGQFRVAFSGRYAGLLRARADHYATSQQGAFAASAPSVRLVHPDLGLGARGQSVRLL